LGGVGCVWERIGRNGERVWQLKYDCKEKKTFNVLDKVERYVSCLRDNALLQWFVLPMKMCG